MSILKFFLLSTLILLSQTVSVALADIISPPALSGWTHVDRDSETRAGLVFDAKRVLYSSPVIAEVDGNAANGKEVVVVGTDYQIHVYAADGSALWRYSMKNLGCRKLPPLMSSPAVAEIYGNGIPYVVIGYGGFSGSKCDGGVIAIRGTDGRKAWQFSTKKFNKKAHEWAKMFGVISTPAIADVDNDGKMEIGFGSFDRHVYLLNYNGSLRWYYIAADTVFSSPAFADVDGDSKLEMIIGTDISQNTRLNPPTQNGGYVYALKTNRRKSKRIGFRDSRAILWKVWFDQVIQGSPVIGDLLPNRQGKEIAVTSGCFFPQKKKLKTGRWIKILAAESGAVLSTLNAPACFSTSPAIADIDEDGQLEVIASVSGLKNTGADGKGRLIAWKADNPEPLWSVIPRVAGRNEASMGTYIAPIVADLDGNGSLEVLVTSGGGVAIYAGRDGSSLSCQLNDCSDNALRIYTGSTLKNTSAIGDLNNDGILELITAGSNSQAAAIFAWTNFSQVLQSPAGSFAPFSTPWPMLRGNAQRNAEFK